MSKEKDAYCEYELKKQELITKQELSLYSVRQIEALESTTRSKIWGFIFLTIAIALLATYIVITIINTNSSVKIQEIQVLKK